MLTPEEGIVLSEELVYIIRISKRISKVFEIFGTFIREVTLWNKDSYLDPFLMKTFLHTEQTQARQLLNEPTDQGLLCLLMEICSYTGGPIK